MGSKLHETRQRIIEHLKENECATVDELAGVVSLTPMAVRYHLNVLQSDNLIHTVAVRRPAAGRGRPQQMYQLTEKADDLFPVDYFSLTGYLLDELDLQLGKEGITQLFCKIANRLAKETPPAGKNQSLQERLDEVVAFLSNKGFVINWEFTNGKYTIHTYSCPYRKLVKNHQQVCLLDQQIISTMLNTNPVRISCLPDGDNHCIYQISEPIQLITPA